MRTQKCYWTFRERSCRRKWAWRRMRGRMWMTRRLMGEIGLEDLSAICFIHEIIWGINRWILIKKPHTTHVQTLKLIEQKLTVLINLRIPPFFSNEPHTRQPLIPFHPQHTILLFIFGFLYLGDSLFTNSFCAINSTSRLIVFSAKILPLQSESQIRIASLRSLTSLYKVFQIRVVSLFTCLFKRHPHVKISEVMIQSFLIFPSETCAVLRLDIILSLNCKLPSVDW